MFKLLKNIVKIAIQDGVTGLAEKVEENSILLEKYGLDLLEAIRMTEMDIQSISNDKSLSQEIDKYLEYSIFANCVTKKLIDNDLMKYFEYFDNKYTIRLNEYESQLTKEGIIFRDHSLLIEQYSYAYEIFEDCIKKDLTKLAAFEYSIAIMKLVNAIYNFENKNILPELDIFCSEIYKKIFAHNEYFSEYFFKISKKIIIYNINELKLFNEEKNLHHSPILWQNKNYHSLDSILKNYKNLDSFHIFLGTMDESILRFYIDLVKIYARCNVKIAISLLDLIEIDGFKAEAAAHICNCTNDEKIRFSIFNKIIEEVRGEDELKIFRETLLYISSLENFTLELGYFTLD